MISILDYLHLKPDLIAQPCQEGWLKYGRVQLRATR
jgi:hypothetical protein